MRAACLAIACALYGCTATAVRDMAAPGDAGDAAGAGTASDAGVDAPPSTQPVAGCAARCHGTAASNAPPKDLRGNTGTTVATVGAHQAHLTGATWHLPVACSGCHVVPRTVDAPGHIDGDNIAEVRFDKLNPQAVYTKSTATCSTLYCHGDGLGNNGSLSFVPDDRMECDSCHGFGSLSMSGAHTAHYLLSVECSNCHADEVDSNMRVLKPELHINGVHDVKLATGTWDPALKSCAGTGCHGTFTW